MQPVDDRAALRRSHARTGFESDLAMAGDRQSASSHHDPVVLQPTELDAIRVEQLVDGTVEPDIGDRPEQGSAPERQQQPSQAFGQ